MALPAATPELLPALALFLEEAGKGCEPIPAM